MPAPSTNSAKNGAQHLVDALKQADVQTIFSLSGNQIMPVYDALIDSGIRLIHTRHEGGAVYMAEAHSQMTGEVGIALLTAGPGFANGLSAMYSALASQTPLVVMTGDAPLAMDGRGGFQEMDQSSAARPLAKATYRLQSAATTFDVIQHAIALAASGTPGPVHISLPDDVLRQVAGERDLAGNLARHLEHSTAHTRPAVPAASLINRIKAAKRPLVFGGPSFARPKFAASFEALSEQTGIPFIALESPRGMRAPRIGALAEVLPEADVIVLLGMPPNFMMGFGAPPTFSETAQFICFTDDGTATNEARQRLGPNRLTHVAIDGASALNAFEDTAAGLAPNQVEAGWHQRVGEAVTWRPPEWQAIPSNAPPFHAASVANEIRKFVDDNPDLSLIIDGGEVGQWAQSILDCRHSVINGPSGAIGGSIPYAIAAKAARPDQPSIAILGDGTAGFYFMEFETAIREDLPLVAIVGNDAKWNAEHQIQMRDYGENRTFGCEMNPTRYDNVAQAMGAYSENVTEISEVRPAIERALASGKPACLNIEIQSIAAPAVKRPA